MFLELEHLCLLSKYKVLETISYKMNHNASFIIYPPLEFEQNALGIGHNIEIINLNGSQKVNIIHDIITISWQFATLFVMQLRPSLD